MSVRTSGKQGILPRDKMIAAIAILALAIAIIVIYKAWADRQVQVVLQINGAVGSSEKGQAMKAMQGRGPKGDDESPSDLINPSQFKKN